MDLFQRYWKQLTFEAHEWKRGRDLSFLQQHFSLFLDELEVSSSLWEMAEPRSLGKEWKMGGHPHSVAPEGWLSRPCSCTGQMRLLRRLWQAEEGTEEQE